MNLLPLHETRTERRHRRRSDWSRGSRGGTLGEEHQKNSDPGICTIVHTFFNRIPMLVCLPSIYNCIILSCSLESRRSLLCRPPPHRAPSIINHTMFTRNWKLLIRFQESDLFKCNTYFSLFIWTILHSSVITVLLRSFVDLWFMFVLFSFSLHNYYRCCYFILSMQNNHCKSNILLYVS